LYSPIFNSFSIKKTRLFEPGYKGKEILV